MIGSAERAATCIAPSLGVETMGYIGEEEKVVNVPERSNEPQPLIAPEREEQEVGKREQERELVPSGE